MLFRSVNALLEMCEKNAKENQAKKITKVEVKIGKLSGVEPHLLETAFDTFKEETVCDGAEFIVHLQEIVVRCQAARVNQLCLKMNLSAPNVTVPI